MNGIAATWLTVGFHLPLLIASALWARQLGSGSWTRLVVDSFLLACILWRLESLLLHLFEAIHWGPVLVLHLSLLATSVLALRASLGRPAMSPRPWAPTSVELVAGGWLFLVAGLGVYRVLLLPDPYDSLTYHLMLPARWLQTGSLTLLATPFGHIAPSYTAEAVEGFFLAVMLPSGHDGLARVAQTPFLLAGGYLIFDLIRRELGAAVPRWVPVAGASAYLLLTDLLIQGASSMVDVAAASFFLAAWRELRLAREKRWPAHLVMGGALAGMFLASRVQALLFTPLLLLPWLTEILKHRRGWLLVAIPMLLTGSFPYLRNLMLTGNPVYPLQVELGGQLLLPGLFTSQAALRASFHLSGSDLWDYYWRFFRAAGLLWCGLGLLAPLLRRERCTAWPSAIAAALTLLLLFGVPFNANGRFLFPAWGLWIVAATLALGITRAGRWVLLAALGLLAYETLRIGPFREGVGLGRPLLFASGAVGVFLLGMAQVFLLARLSRASLVAPVLVLVAAWLTGLGALAPLREERLSEIYQRDFAGRYTAFVPGWQLVRRLPEQLRIAYAGLNLPYLLTGPQLSNPVTTVPLDGGPAGLMPHQYRERLGESFQPSTQTGELTLDRMAPDRRAWQAAVLREEIDLLALYLTRGREPKEYGWALGDPDRFELLNPGYAGGALKIFRVRRAAP